MPDDSDGERPPSEAGREETRAEDAVGGGKVKDYKGLLVWQVAMQVVDDVYAVVGCMPHFERYALGAQLIRAAVSVPSNIAEGRCRASLREYLHGLVISRASLTETETQLLIGARQGYLSGDHPALDHVRRCRALLQGLINSLKQ